MLENTPIRSSSVEELDSFSVNRKSGNLDESAGLDSKVGVVLKDWSAKDFSDLYVRFRPHLMRHARRFLRDEMQAEEVVQDAFLYLMTALPELDSELGVMRFMKWKTKMLSLDLIRSSASGINSNLTTLPDDLTDEKQPADFIERADDAAIVSLALAKLSARHREVLISSIYEEKGTAELARQMGMSENAIRQLLFRARASFRRALVGEADLEGKSAAEILSVAAKRVASARSLGVMAVLMAASFSVSPLFGTAVAPLATDEATVAAVGPTSNEASADRENEALEVGASKSGEELEAPNPELEQQFVPSLQNSIPEPANESNAGAESSNGNSLDDDPEFLKDRQSRDKFGESLGAELVNSLSLSRLSVTEGNGELTVMDGSGLRANFALDTASATIVQYVSVEYERDGTVWKAVPTNSLTVMEDKDEQTLLSYAATDFLVGDFSGEFDYVSTTQSVFSRSGIKLDLILDKEGHIVSSAVSFIPST